MSGNGADHMRKVLKPKLIIGDVQRERHRPRGAMW
jgi:hypothetical protein